MARRENVICPQSGLSPMCVRGLQKYDVSIPAASGCSVYLIRFKKHVVHITSCLTLQTHCSCTSLVADVAATAHSNTLCTQNITTLLPLSQPLAFQVTGFGLCLIWFPLAYFLFHRTELRYFLPVQYRKVGRCCFLHVQIS